MKNTKFFSDFQSCVDDAEIDRLKLKLIDSSLIAINLQLQKLDYRNSADLDRIRALLFESGILSRKRLEIMARFLNG